MVCGWCGCCCSHYNKCRSVSPSDENEFVISCLDVFSQLNQRVRQKNRNLGKMLKHHCNCQYVSLSITHDAKLTIKDISFVKFQLR